MSTLNLLSDVEYVSMRSNVVYERDSGSYLVVKTKESVYMVLCFYMCRFSGLQMCDILLNHIPFRYVDAIIRLSLVHIKTVSLPSHHFGCIAGMFKDKAFQVKSAVDKRGRKVKSGRAKEDMRKYYRLHNEEVGPHLSCRMFVVYGIDIC